MSRRTGAILLAALVLVGLAGAAGPGTDAGGLRAAARLPVPVVVVERTGGFRRAESLEPLPVAALFGDGVLITLGPQIAVFPPPALENVRRRQLSREALTAVRLLARSAGLSQPPADYGRPSVTDAPTTQVSYRGTDGRTYVHRAYGLTATRGVPVAARDARLRLRRFVEQISAPVTTFGAANVGASTAFAATALELVATRAPGGGAAARTWPLRSVRLDQSSSCTPVTGPDVATLRAGLRSATTLTRWREAERVYTLAIRPVLPGDAACR